MKELGIHVSWAFGMQTSSAFGSDICGEDTNTHVRFNGELGHILQIICFLCALSPRLHRHRAGSNINTVPATYDCVMAT